MTHHYYLALAAQPFWRHYHASPMPPPIKLPGWGPDIPSPVFTVILWRRDRVAGGRYEPAHAYVNASMRERCLLAVISISICGRLCCLTFALGVQRAREAC